MYNNWNKLKGALSAFVHGTTHGLEIYLKLCKLLPELCHRILEWLVLEGTLEIISPYPAGGPQVQMADKSNLRTNMHSAFSESRRRKGSPNFVSALFRHSQGRTFSKAAA